MYEPIDLAKAQRHFTKTDPIMAALLRDALRANTPLVAPSARAPRQYFAAIASSIVSQQISTKAANAVHRRLVAAAGTITPESIGRMTDAELRACGLSSQKATYLKTNAGLWHTIPVRSFKTMDDEAIIMELTKLYGVGRWTAEMFLMFSMARPDVFSYGDYGLMSSLYTHYPVKKHWKRRITATVEAWAPHRTAASLALWFRKDNRPTI